MKARTTMMAAAMAAIALAGCTDDVPNNAVICTNLGPITLEFYSQAPITANNFANLAKDGYYDGVIFHRIINDFMMQGGDPQGTGRGGEAHGGGSIPDEFHPSLRHDRAGIVSMANSGPNTGGSQFFITFGPTPHLDDKHSIFAVVVDGMDVVERVNEEAASQGGTPRIDVYMQTVLVDQPASDCPEPDGVPEPVPAHACPVVGRQDATGDLVADAITPGVLCITKEEDQVLVWARSFSGSHDVNWRLTGANGAALPDGWAVAFEQATGSIGGTGQATHTLMTVTVPAAADGEFPLELRTGSSVTDLTAYVDLQHDEISAKGSNVALSYAGSCTRDGQAFDSGSFSTTLGSGQTIPGFDLGLIGLGESETTTIVIPAPLGYGNNGPVCSGDDADLTFRVTINKL